MEPDYLKTLNVYFFYALITESLNEHPIRLDASEGTGAGLNSQAKKTPPKVGYAQTDRISTSKSERGDQNGKNEHTGTENNGQ